MDAERFDTLTRTLTLARTRRRALGGLLLGSLGLLGRGAENADAHNAVKKCKKKSGKQKKKCLKKAKKHNAEHAAETPSPPPPAPCADGIKNGSETDVDCGGSCPRCTAGKTCVSASDCETGLCFPATDTCRHCTFDPDCLGDASGRCRCSVTSRCIKYEAAFQTSSCTQCPAGTTCQGIANSTMVGCHYLCGGINYCPAGVDACKGSTATCGNGGKCFQPRGGGPTRCGVSTGACGCTSDQECEATHGTQAFCVQDTGTACSGCSSGTFCATPR